MTTETIVQIAIPLVLATIMLAMGLGLEPDDFRRVLVKPRAVLAGVISQLVILPLVGFLLAWGFGLQPELAVGLVLVACCPGGPSSNLMANLARGDTALSVTLTALSGLVTIITIPLLINLALDFFMQGMEAPELPMLKTNAQLLLTVGVPVALGMLWRAKARASALRWEVRLRRLAVVLLVVLIIGAVAKEAARVVSFAGEVGSAVLALTALTMGLGFALARGLRLGGPQSVTITLEVGMQNAAMAIAIATGLLGSTAIAIPGVVYGLWMYAPCALIVFIARRLLPPLPEASAQA